VSVRAVRVDSKLKAADKENGERRRRRRINKHHPALFAESVCHPLSAIMNTRIRCTPRV